MLSALRFAYNLPRNSFIDFRSLNFRSYYDVLQSRQMNLFLSALLSVTVIYKFGNYPKEFFSIVLAKTFAMLYRVISLKEVS